MSKFDMRSVVSIIGMFEGCASKILCVNNWNTERLKYMNETFSGVQLDEIDLSKWDTRNVVSMAMAFSKSRICKLRINGIDVNNVEDVSFMFCGAHIDRIDISDWKLANDIQTIAMFSEAVSDKLLLPKRDVPENKRMLYKCSIQDIDFNGCKDMYGIDAERLEVKQKSRHRWFFN